MAHQFKFGDKVHHSQFGIGVVVQGDIHNKVGVVFNGQDVILYFDYDLVDLPWNTSELKLISDWNEIDYQDKSTYPAVGSWYLTVDGTVSNWDNWDGVSMLFLDKSLEDDNLIWIGNGSDIEFSNITHWQPLPQPPKDK